MEDSIVARLERLGWRRNAAGTLCQPPDCPRVGLKRYSDQLGTRYRIATDSQLSRRRLYIRGIDGQIIDSRLEKAEPWAPVKGPGRLERLREGDGPLS